jgi:hypothetical protein
MSGRKEADKGRRAERRVQTMLTMDGYYVIKSGGSFGPADLVAAKPGEWLLVQVKAGGARLDHEWFNQLYHLATFLSGGSHAGAWNRVLAIIADFPYPEPGWKNGQMRLRKIIAPHVKFLHTWPVAPFRTDEVDDDVADVHSG